MASPPEWLVGWTEYLMLLVALYAAAKAAFKGARSLL
jgi:hypothetical protein